LFILIFPQSPYSSKQSSCCDYNSYKYTLF